MQLPTAVDIAHEIPAMVAEAGGSFDLQNLEYSVSRRFLPRVHAIKREGGDDYLHQAFNDAITIVIRNGLINSSGTRLLLTEKGWEQAATVIDRGGDGPQPLDPDESVVDMSKAEPVIEFRRRDTVVRGYLSESADQFHGKPLTMTPGQLLDEVYRTEIDGESAEVGFCTALRDNGLMRDISQLIEKSGILLPGMSRPVVRRGVRRPGRRPGATWPRVVCEVIAEAGGHADWPTIADAASRRPEAELDIGWRELALQALRNNTIPQGHCYFEAAEIGDKGVFALTDDGRRMASKRTLDDRAPTLSKYLASATDSNSNSPLTDMELYTLLFLATRLGKPAEARSIYHRLPPDFPDEDSYAMIPMWIEQAERTQGED